MAGNDLAMARTQTKHNFQWKLSNCDEFSTKDNVFLPVNVQKKGKCKMLEYGFIQLAIIDPQRMSL